MSSVQPILLNADDVCQRLAISRTSLWRLVKLGKFPAAVELGTLRRWRTVDVDSWVDAGGTRASPSEAAGARGAKGPA